MDEHPSRQWPELPEAMRRNIWRPLNTERRETRILTLLPDTDVDARPKIKLEIVSLDDDPVYDAISYTWGNRNEKAPVWIDDDECHEFYVSIHLVQALNNMRDTVIPKKFWADGLCIDQYNEGEKVNQQIPLMGPIFSKASAVQVWLGQSADYSDRAMQVMKGIAEGRQIEDIIVDGRRIEAADLEPLKTLLSRPYWSRTWILQEVALARQLTFHCGNTKLWRNEVPQPAQLLDFLAAAEAKLITTKEQRQEWLSNQQKDVLDSFSNYSCFGYLLEDLIGDYKCMKNVITLQEMMRQKCTERNDHVYALLGLAGFEFAKKVQPSSRKTASAVCRDFTHAWIEHFKDMSILSIAVGVPTNHPTTDTDTGQSAEIHTTIDTPSWCPELLDPSSNLKSSRRLTLSHWFLKNRWITQETYLTPEGALSLTGCYFDQIVACHAMTRPTGTLPDKSTEQYDEQAAQVHHQWRAFFGLTSGTQDVPYPGGGRLEDAYWRTITRQMHKPWDLQLGDQIWICRDLIEACIKWFADPEAAPLGSQEQFRLYHRGLSASEGDHLFKTAHGYMGVSQGPTVPKVGDQIFLIAGASMPFVLRACEISACNTRFQLLCESYVHGVMERRGVSVEEAATELEERLGNGVAWSELSDLPNHVQMGATAVWKRIFLF